eukprot:TRINITY_DN27880_c0_g1_i1.p1 TRINITY_DN27880_c0_g1~~TRINITY_DN27880_c0_g1_i1.p1  ORF type:complete len:433 (+),score=96.90 TRINITY_DN27880_c0_g1_i1:1034-2332(+)
MVGSLWAVELAREGAGSFELNSGNFALLKRLVQLKVEAMMMQVVAEASMLKMEQAMSCKADVDASSKGVGKGAKSGRPSSSAPVGTPIAAAAIPALSDGSSLLLVSEALIRACGQMDLTNILRRCLEDTHLEGRAGVVQALLVDLSENVETLGIFTTPAGSPGPAGVAPTTPGAGAGAAAAAPAAGEGEEPMPAATPEVPSMAAWGRSAASGGLSKPRPAAPLNGPPCPRCLAVSALICREALDGPHAEQLQAHSVALRLWLRARAQRSVASALLRGRTAQTLAGAHMKRTNLRFIEMLWRRALLGPHLVEHSEVRCMALQQASGFVQPLTSSDLQVLQAGDIPIHCDEVRANLNKTIGNLLSSHLGRLKASLHTEKPDPARQAASGGGGSGGGSDSDVGSQGRMGVIGQLCGVLRGLDLLELARTHVAGAP